MFCFNTINYFDKYTVYFSYPKSWVMWAIIDLHDYLMFFIINIFLVVFIYMFLILFTQQKFFLKIEFIRNYVFLNVKDYNDEPLLEFFWTIFPALLLAVMSWPSFTLLYAMEQLIDPFHTVIITGNQWYWTYQYSDFDAVSDIIIQLDSMKGLNYFSKIIKKELNLSLIYDEMRFIYPAYLNKPIHVAGLTLYNCSYEAYPIYRTLPVDLDFDVNEAFGAELSVPVFTINPDSDYTSIIHSALEVANQFVTLELDNLINSNRHVFYYEEDWSNICKLYAAGDIYGYIVSSIANDLKNSLLIKNSFNYWDLIQFIGKHARKYENTQLIYDAMIITDDNLPVGYPRLLCTDQVLVLPANVSIRLLITSNDVIHSWALPSHGIKMDAIPGRINQVPFLTPFWGTYWGQCSELCGINHGFMPIEVRVVCLEDYLSFIKLNVSYKYDKFCPLIRNLIASYVINLAEETLNKK